MELGTIREESQVYTIWNSTGITDKGGIEICS